MNHYSMSDIAIGLEEKFSVKITEEMMKSFRDITGDINPMHTDKDECIRGGYRDRLVYGMLTASFFSTLVGVYLPGEKCLFHKCDVEWPAPVYIGDTLFIAGRIIDIDKMFNRITIKAYIRNQDGKKVARAKLIAGVRE